MKSRRKILISLHPPLSLATISQESKARLYLAGGCKGDAAARLQSWSSIPKTWTFVKNLLLLSLTPGHTFCAGSLLLNGDVVFIRRGVEWPVHAYWSWKWSSYRLGSSLFYLIHSVHCQGDNCGCYLFATRALFPSTMQVQRITKVRATILLLDAYYIHFTAKPVKSEKPWLFQVPPVRCNSFPVPFPVLTRITPDQPCMRTLYKITSHNTNTDSASYGKSYRHPVMIAEVSKCIVSNAETMEISRYHTPLLLAHSVYLASVIKTDWSWRTPEQGVGVNMVAFMSHSLIMWAANR